MRLCNCYNIKRCDYYGNIFYEYTSGGYGLSVSTMEDILQFIEELNCEGN